MACVKDVIGGLLRHPKNLIDAAWIDRMNESLSKENLGLPHVQPFTKCDSYL